MSDSNRRAVRQERERTHALRLDRDAIVQGCIALVLAFLVAWLFNLR